MISEQKPIWGLNKLLSVLISAGLMIVVVVLMLGAYFAPNIGLSLIIIGAFGFLPIGIVMGGVMIDTHLRCKILKGLTKRNLGVVNFISGNEIHSKIKDFDNDTLEAKNKLFYLMKGRVCNDKGEPMSTVEAEFIKFKSGIPTIYFDTTNAIPLSFHEDKLKIDPSQIAGVTIAHTTIQEAKLLKTGKQQLFISAFVLIGLIACAIYFAYTADQKTELIISMLEKAISQSSTVVQGGG